MKHISYRSIIAFVIVVVLSVPVNYYLFDIRFPQLLQSAVLCALFAFTFFKSASIQYKALRRLNERWQQCRSFRIFLPAPKTVLAVVLGLPIIYFCLTAQTMALVEMSWAAVGENIVRNHGIWHLQMYVFIGLFIYALYLWVNGSSISSKTLRSWKEIICYQVLFVLGLPFVGIIPFSPPSKDFSIEFFCYDFWYFMCIIFYAVLVFICMPRNIVLDQCRQEGRSLLRCMIPTRLQMVFLLPSLVGISFSRLALTLGLTHITLPKFFEALAIYIVGWFVFVGLRILVRRFF